MQKIIWSLHYIEIINDNKEQQKENQIIVKQHGKRSQENYK